MIAIRFYIDPVSGEPHCLNHGVTEDDVFEVFSCPIEDIRGDNRSRIAIGRGIGGSLLKVIYSTDPESVFVITAYPLVGKQLAAHRRRMRSKKR